MFFFQDKTDNLKSCFWKGSMVSGTERQGAVLVQSVLTQK